MKLTLLVLSPIITAALLNLTNALFKAQVTIHYTNASVLNTFNTYVNNLKKSIVYLKGRAALRLGEILSATCRYILK